MPIWPPFPFSSRTAATQGLLQHGGRVAQRRELRGHLGQRPLRLDAVGQLVGLLAQVLLEPSDLGDVAVRAVGADQAAVGIHDAHAADLDRQRAAVLARLEDPDPVHPVGMLLELGEGRRAPSPSTPARSRPTRAGR